MKIRGLAAASAVLVLAAGVVAAVTAVTASPWPGALLIRFVFGRDAAKVKTALEPHAPDDVRRIGNQRYGAGPDALLDVYLSASVADGEALPTIVWTHGGAWISGNKRDAAPYFAILAAAGYTVVAPDYSVGPGRQYPTAVLQLNDALRYLHDNAERLHIDRTRIVLAGDSAGAQLTSQLAAIVTNPDYARAMGITPALDATQLKGLVLCCGVYNMAALDHLRGVLGWGFHIATWSYSGVRHYTSDPALKLMSTVDYVTADFPAAFITGGNGDGLTAIQSKPLASRSWRAWASPRRRCSSLTTTRRHSRTSTSSLWTLRRARMRSSGFWDSSRSVSTPRRPRGDICAAFSWFGRFN